MKVYHYDKRTKEFTHSTKARRNPLEREKYLVPAYSTLVEPSDPIENTETVFDEKVGAWHLVDDYRKKPFYNKLTKKEKHYELGEMPTEEYTDEEPDRGQVWNDGWEYDLDILRDECKALLKIGYETDMQDWDKTMTTAQAMVKAVMLMMYWVDEGMKKDEKPEYWIAWKAQRDAIMVKQTEYKEWIMDVNRTAEELLDFEWEKDVRRCQMDTLILLVNMLLLLLVGLSLLSSF